MFKKILDFDHNPAVYAATYSLPWLSAAGNALSAWRRHFQLSIMIPSVSQARDRGYPGSQARVRSPDGKQSDCIPSSVAWYYLVGYLCTCCYHQAHIERTHKCAGSSSHEIFLTVTQAYITELQDVLHATTPSSAMSVEASESRRSKNENPV